MEDCIFCKIVRGEMDAYKVYADDNLISFLDIYPEASGHTLVIPKKHWPRYVDMDDDSFGQLMKRAKSLAQALERASGDEMIFLKLIGTDVPHVHVHLIPRSFKGTKKNDFRALQEQIIKAIKN